MTDTDLTFIEEDIPTIVREGYTRTPTKWEDLLAPLKEKQGRSFRVWKYSKKSAGTSRVAAVRARFIEVTPEDNWTFAVRPIEDGNEAGEVGVYVRYNGQYTPEEVLANAQKRQERSDRIKTQRAAAANVTAPGEATAPPQTAVERVQAAKKAVSK